MKKIILSTIATSAILLSTASFAGDISIIVHKDNAMSQADTKTISKFFLNKKKTFPDSSQRILLLDQKEGSGERNGFYKTVVNKTPSQLKSYWSKIIFTGKGKPPKIIDSQAEIIKAVASNPSAIAYVDSSLVNDSVKVLKTYNY
jgi:ABC-type phosphate transport system substrate-binding protein